MTAIAALWLPILASAVIVFIASSIIHMAKLWHRDELPAPPDGDRLQDAMRPFRLQPGEYMLPRPKDMKDCNAPEFVEKLSRGPVLLMTVIANGPMSMSKPLVQWFIFVVVVSVLTAYLAGATLPADAPVPRRFPRRGHDGVHRVWRGRLAAVDLVPPPLADDAEVHARRADLRLADRRRLRVVMAHGVDVVIVPTAHEDYLRLECSGTFSQEFALDVCERAFTLAAEAGRPAVLVDIRGVTGREPTMAERYQQAVCVADAQAATKPRIRLALLGFEPMIHPERFGEIVAANRGADIGVFTDEALAMEWLVGRQDEP